MAALIHPLAIPNPRKYYWLPTSIFSFRRGKMTVSNFSVVPPSRLIPRPNKGSPKWSVRGVSDTMEPSPVFELGRFIKCLQNGTYYKQIGINVLNHTG